MNVVTAAQDGPEGVGMINGTGPSGMVAYRGRHIRGKKTRSAARLYLNLAGLPVRHVS